MDGDVRKAGALGPPAESSRKDGGFHLPALLGATAVAEDDLVSFPPRFTREANVLIKTGTSPNLLVLTALLKPRVPGPRRTGQLP